MSCDSPCALVTQQFERILPQSIATLQDAKTALSDLSALAKTVEDIPTVSVDVQNPSVLLSPFVSPATPVVPTAVPTYVDGPELLRTTDVKPFDLDPPPAFTGTRPDINTSIALPSDYDPTLPSEPALMDVDVPAEPNPTMPTRPALRAIVVSDIPDVNVPDFEGALGDPPVAPNAAFNYSEQPYTSTLLTQLQSQVVSVIQSGGLSLFDSTTDAIWAKARARETEAADAIEDQVMNDAAARHWPSWGPFQQAQVRRTREKSRDSMAASLREQAISQDQARIANLTQFVQIGMGLETALIGHFDQVQSRALQAAWYTVQSVIAFFEQKVAVFREEREKYLADVQVLVGRIQGENLRLEGARTKLEPQKLASDLNRQDIDIYLADYKAVEEALAVDEQKLKRRGLILQFNGQKLDNFGKSLQGIATKVQIKLGQYQNWRTQMEGQATKAQVWATDVGAWNAQVGAWRSLLGGKKDQKDIEIAVGLDAPIKKMQAQLSQAQAQWQRENQRVGLVLQGGELNVKKYQADVGREEARTRSNATDFQAQASFNEETARLRQANAQINIERAEKALQMGLGALQAIAQVYAQLEAAMLSAVNLAAHVQASDSTSTTDFTEHLYQYQQ